MTESSEQELYTIPSSSSWFKWDEIHAEEERALPEFFDRSAFSRNPRVYREYRDFIINKFRENPSRRLTFTEVRKSLVGDVGSLRKVFLALERWGLINFGVSGEGSPEIDGGDGGTAVVVVEDGAPAGLKVVPASGERGSASSASTDAGGSGENGFRMPPLTSYTDVFGDWMPRKGPMCGSCGAVCDSGQSESTKDGSAICTKCVEKKNSIGEKSLDDVKVNNHVDGSDNHVLTAWTDAETLVLLEAVIKHGDDWDLIAQHVRTKSKLECIAKLIQLPFAEHMVGPTTDKLDNTQSSNEGTQFKVAESLVKEVPQESINADREKHIGTDDDEELGGLSSPTCCLKRRRFPSFTDPTDSLMKQVALLSTVAGPHVAAAAAEFAVTALCHENPCARKAFEIGENEVANKLGSSEMKSDHTSEVKIEDQDMKRQKRRGKEDISPEKNLGATTFRIRAAVATSIGVAAARATLLENQEEREIELLMTSIIEMQLKKIQSKMKHFEELEHIMEIEYAQIQQLKESILEEWTDILQQAFHAGIPSWRDNGFPKFQLDANASSISQLH